VTVKYGAAIYRIQIENPHGVCRGIALVELDGRNLAADVGAPEPSSRPAEGELVSTSFAKSGGAELPAQKGPPTTGAGQTATVPGRLGQAVSDVPGEQQSSTGRSIPLTDDGQAHSVRVVMG
jgi:hypothetical protein